MCFLCARSCLQRLAVSASAGSCSFTSGGGTTSSSTGGTTGPLKVGAPCPSSRWPGVMAPPPTFKITEVDEHLKWNPHIRTGYRQGYTLGQCLRSLFSIHNETGNVWSHFLAVPLFAWAMYYTLTFVLVSDSLSHQAIWVCFFLSAIVCFVGSALYHLCFPQSIAAVYWLGILDFTGIAALVLGSYYPPVFYGFYFFPFWQRLYLFSISLLGTITLITPWFSFFHSQRYLVVRVCLYAMVALAGVVPAIHSRFLFTNFPPAEAIDMNEVYFRLYIMYGLYALGVFFYLSKFPESRFPGKFDIWLNSHQWWHLLVVCGTLVHWSNCLLIYDNYSFIANSNTYN